MSNRVNFIQLMMKEFFRYLKVRGRNREKIGEGEKEKRIKKCLPSVTFFPFHP